MSQRWFFAARIALMAGGLAVRPAARALDLPNLTGEWQLNPDASDDPQRVMKDAGSSGGGWSGGGMGHGAHGRGGGSRRGASRGDANDSADPGDRFPAMTTLQIRHTEPTLAITDAAGRERILYTDGRRTEEEHSHGGTTAVTASWRDGHLEIVSKPETGGKIVETFAVTGDGSQLTVTTKMEGSRGHSFTIRRVYDAVKPGTPKPTPRPRPAPAPDDDEGVDQSV